MVRYLLLALLAMPTSMLKADEWLQPLSGRPFLAEGSLQALEPWETPVEGFFVRSHFSTIPEINGETWTIKIDGLVSRPMTFSVRDFGKHLDADTYAVLECSGNGRGRQSPNVAGVQWEKGAAANGRWQGVSLAQLLQKVQPTSTARYLTVEGGDASPTAGVPNFIRSIPLDLVKSQNAFLALRLNEESLAPGHGGPVRLVLPGVYGQNWIKWVRRITLSASEDQGFYMRKGYRYPKEAVKPNTPWDSATGNPITLLRVQSLITSHRDRTSLPLGEAVTLKGKAFSGYGSITEVLWSTDEKTWQAATVSPSRGKYSWQEFTFTLQPGDARALQITTKAKDSAGNEQPLNADWNPSGYLYNAVDRVHLVFDEQAAALLRGRALVAAHCTSCHGIELLARQRLDAAGWDKSVKKMVQFGVTLAANDDQLLVKYLASDLRAHDMEKRLESLPAGAEALLLPPERLQKGNAAQGEALYRSKCQICHEPAAKNPLTAPRLKGRFVDDWTYWTTVRLGRGAMPAWQGQLTIAQMRAVRTYLRQNDRKKITEK